MLTEAHIVATKSDIEDWVRMVVPLHALPIENFIMTFWKTNRLTQKYIGKSKLGFANDTNIYVSQNLTFFFFFSIWVFFHEHSQFTGQQGKGEGIYLTPLYHFHPLHRHLDISRAITAESSPLHIAGSRTRTGNIWFPSASR